LFGSLFFITTLLPVLQIVPVGNAVVAERYSFIPMVGIYFIFTAMISFLLKEKLKGSKVVKTLLFLVVAIPLIILTNARCRVWQNSFTLWNDVINKYPVAKAFLGRGIAYNDKGDYDRAIEDFDHAVSLNPPGALASVTYNNRGTAYINKGLYNRAVDDFNKSIVLNMKNYEAYYNRANAYYYQNDFNRAIEDYTQTIRIKPAYSFAYCNRGAAYCGIGAYNRGIEDFNQALRLNPNDEKSYYCRGLALREKGDISNSMDDFKKACNLGFELACKQLNGN
jgi:tetratricopeptide (TPR) repeat protein